MISLSRQVQRTVPLAVGMICLVLAGAIWMPLVDDDQVSLPVNAPAAPAARADISSQLAEGSEELLARPLFHITRRPPEVAAPVVPEAPPPVTLSLTGIVNDETDRIALMRLSSQPELLRGREGENIGDWTIEEITENTVTVANGDGDRMIMSLTSNDN